MIRVCFILFFRRLADTGTINKSKQLQFKEQSTGRSRKIGYLQVYPQNFQAEIETKHIVKTEIANF